MDRTGDRHVIIDTGENVEATIPAAGVMSVFGKTNTIIINNPSQPDNVQKGAYCLSASSLSNSAKISVIYTLAKESHTSIDIYNVKGKNIANLFSGVCAPGVYTRIWDSSITGPGMYLVKMKVGTEITAVLKLIVKR